MISEKGHNFLYIAYIMPRQIIYELIERKTVSCNKYDIAFRRIVHVLRSWLIEANVTFGSPYMIILYYTNNEANSF